MPKTCLGKMDRNKNKVSFNFPKSLEIASINKEADLLHPCAHPCAHECLLFLCTFGAARLPLTTGSTLCLSTYSIAQQPDNDQTNDMVYPFGRGNIGLTEELKRCKSDENKPIDVGFVDGLFELYKLRGKIAKARAQLLSTSVLSGYPHKFGTFFIQLASELYIHFDT